MTNRIAVPACQLTVFLIFCQAMVVSGLRAEPFKLSGPGVVLTWDHADGRLRLTQVQCDDQQPLLYSDKETKQAGPGPVGNPLAVVIEQGKYAGRYGMETFRVIKLDRGERQLHAYLSHDTLPLQVAIQVRVEGHEAELPAARPA